MYVMAFLGRTQDVTGGQHGQDHYVYWVPARVLNELPIKLWKYNRPPDPDRVTEIRLHMETSKRMDGVIYLAHLSDELVCYESNHRRQALKEMKSVDGMAYILVDVLENATHEKIRDEFNRLNKAVSVPEIYITPEPKISLEELRELTDGFCKNYASCKVNSNRPQHPNFNRDMVSDEFYRIMKETNLSVNEFTNRLTQVNRDMSMRDRRKLSAKVIEKCEKSGLWLFAWSSKLNAKDFVD
jgi:hypothetical protein